MTTTTAAADRLIVRAALASFASAVLGLVIWQATGHPNFATPDQPLGRAALGSTVGILIGEGVLVGLLLIALLTSRRRSRRH